MWGKEGGGGILGVAHHQVRLQGLPALIPGNGRVARGLLDQVANQ